MSTKEAVEGKKSPWPEETGVWGSYDLHCHCGAVRFNMKMSPPLFEDESQGKGIWPVTDCQCSWCQRNGQLAVHPTVDNLTWTKGRDNLTEYKFGNRSAKHLFCKSCGSCVGSDLSELTKVFGPPARYAINTRMLKDCDLSKLTIVKSDFMKNMPPQYSID